MGNEEEVGRRNAEVYQEMVARLKEPWILHRAALSLTADLLDFSAQMLQSSGQTIYPTQRIDGPDGRVLVTMRGQDYEELTRSSGLHALTGMNEIAAEVLREEEGGADGAT